MSNNSQWWKEKPADLLIRRRGVRSNPSQCQNAPLVVKAGSVKLRVRKHEAELCTLHDLYVCIMWSVSQSKKMAFLQAKKKKKKSLFIFFKPLPYYFILACNFSFLSQRRQLTSLTNSAAIRLSRMQYLHFKIWGVLHCKSTITIQVPGAKT